VIAIGVNVIGGLHAEDSRDRVPPDLDRHRSGEDHEASGGQGAWDDLICQLSPHGCEGDGHQGAWCEEDTNGGWRGVCQKLGIQH
jgi:hypothetical protein